MDAVAAGLGADVVDRVADAGGLPLDDVVVAGEAEAQHVHQRVAGVHLVEDDLAADGRDPDAVAVAADAGHHALEDAPGQRRVERSEAERVQQRHRARAHGEDVADDAPDAGGGALVGLDERRVVVRLDLEDGRQPVADVDGAGVLARPLHHPRPGGRQRLQVHARALVAAVFRPHHREEAQLQQVRLAAEQFLDARVLALGDAVLAEQVLVDHAHARAACGRAAPRLATRPSAYALTTDSSTTRPSALPIHGSEARSGWGISPTTLRAALQIPAMLWREPLGFAVVGGLAPAVDVAEDHLAIGFEGGRQVGVGEVVALAVGDRQPEHLALGARPGERRVGLFDPHRQDARHELEAAVADHRPRQQARLEQHLEAIADAEHRSAPRGEGRDAGHDRREAGDRAGAQVVAVGEAARQDHRIRITQAGVLVPDERGPLADHRARRVERVAVGIRSRKDDHCEVHRVPSLAASRCSRQSTSTR